MKYLIVGSGHYMMEWWMKNKFYFNSHKDEWMIFVINNAWWLLLSQEKYTGNWVWALPNDFYARGTLLPSDEQILSIPNVMIYSGKEKKPDVKILRRDCKLDNGKVNWFDFKCSDKAGDTGDAGYIDKEGKSGTMFLNVAWDLLYQCDKNKDSIYIIGNDMIYNKGTGPGNIPMNHYYTPIQKDLNRIRKKADQQPSKASDDPLRYGEKWIENELQHLYDTAYKRDIRIYNLSTYQTRLPFDKVAL